MKLKELFENLQTLSQLRPQLVKAAQRVYDDWDENPDEYAGGGVCHLIADSIAATINDKTSYEAVPVSRIMGEVHVYTVVKTEDGVYEVDISPYTYERGAGYSWRKIPNVIFEPSDVQINRLDRNPENFENYIDE